MSRIAIGRAVFVGWTADERASSIGRGGRCRTGVVSGGPFPAGLKMRTEDGELGILPTRAWNVWLDSTPGRPRIEVCATERILFPIDDLPDSIEESNTERRPASKSSDHDQGRCGRSLELGPGEEGACSRRSAPAKPNVGRSGASEELLSVRVGPPRIRDAGG